MTQSYASLSDSQLPWNLNYLDWFSSWIVTKLTLFFFFLFWLRRDFFFYLFICILYFLNFWSFTVVHSFQPPRFWSFFQLKKKKKSFLGIWVFHPDLMWEISALFSVRDLFAICCFHCITLSFPTYSQCWKAIVFNDRSGRIAEVNSFSFFVIKQLYEMMDPGRYVAEIWGRKIKDLLKERWLHLNPC